MSKVKGKSILAGLPKVFCDKCRALLQESIVGKRQLMRYKYHLGLLVKDAIELEATLEPWMEVKTKVIKYLHISDRTYGRVYRLVSLFTEEDIDELIKPTEDGYCIGWGHFDFAMVDYLNKKEMIHYLHLARERHLCSTAMYNMIKEENEREEDPQNRKQIKTADQFMAVMQEYLSLCEEKDTIFDEVSPTLLDQWIQTMSRSKREKFIQQFDKHLVCCFLLKRKLQNQ